MLVIVEIRQDRPPKPITDSGRLPLIINEDTIRLLEVLTRRFSTKGFVFTTKTGEILDMKHLLDVLASDGYIYVYRVSKGPSIIPCALIVRVPTSPTYLVAGESPHKYPMYNDLTNSISITEN